MEQRAALGPPRRGHAWFDRAIRTSRGRSAAEHERSGAKALPPWHLGCGLLQVGEGGSIPPGLPTGWVGVRRAALPHSTRGVGCHLRCAYGSCIAHLSCGSDPHERCAVDERYQHRACKAEGRQ